MRRHPGDVILGLECGVLGGRGEHVRDKCFGVSVNGLGFRASETG